MVIGGQAVLVYGEPRLTKDIDITLGLGIEEFHRVKNAVDSLKLKSLVENNEEFVKQTMVFPVIDDESGIRIDFIFSFSLYEREAIDRAREIPLGNTSVRFASLEDLIIHKVIAGRPRDLEDVRIILIKNPDYDEDYIRSWLHEFDNTLTENYVEVFSKLVPEKR